MIESWFDHFNTFLHAHPQVMAHLALLFRLKCALLTVLALYFVYLAYKPETKPVEDEAPAYEFEA